MKSPNIQPSPAASPSEDAQIYSVLCQLDLRTMEAGEMLTTIRCIAAISTKWIHPVAVVSSGHASAVAGCGAWEASFSCKGEPSASCDPWCFAERLERDDHSPGPETIVLSGSRFVSVGFSAFSRCPYDYDTDHHCLEAKFSRPMLCQVHH